MIFTSLLMKGSDPSAPLHHDGPIKCKDEVAETAWMLTQSEVKTKQWRTQSSTLTPMMGSSREIHIIEGHLRLVGDLTLEDVVQWRAICRALHVEAEPYTIAIAFSEDASGRKLLG